MRNHQIFALTFYFEQEVLDLRQHIAMSLMPSISAIVLLYLLKRFVYYKNQRLCYQKLSMLSLGLSLSILTVLVYSDTASLNRG